MGVCDNLRPLLFRVVEGDASPEESLRVARHLSDCTTCKIVLARERRLAQTLDGLLDTLPTDATFVDRVLAELPPPPDRPVEGRSDTRSRRRRGLRLLGVALAVAAGSGAAVLAAATSAWEIPWIARLHTEAIPATVEAAGWIARAGASIFGSLVAGIPLDAPRFHFAPPIAAVPPMIAVLAGVAFAAAAGLMARSVVRARH